MGKIRYLRLDRPEERETGLGREELAVLLGEREPGEAAARRSAPQPEGGKEQRKKSR